MTNLTLEDVTSLAGVDVLDHLDRQVSVPVLDGLQFQGDVAVVPAAATAIGDDLPKTGVPVVRGENGGNTHLLIADGPGVTWAAGIGTGEALTLGTVTVPAGATAYLIHPEHGASGLAPGTYELRRQREQRDVIALVAD